MSIGSQTNANNYCRVVLGHRAGLDLVRLINSARDIQKVEGECAHTSRIPLEQKSLLILQIARTRRGEQPTEAGSQERMETKGKRFLLVISGFWLNGAHSVHFVGYEMQIPLLAEPEAVFMHCA